jgi:hypothetical protein
VSQRLLATVRRAAESAQLVTAMAEAEIDVPLVTLGRSLTSAAQVAQSMRSADWQVLDQLQKLEDPAADQVRNTLRTGAATNEDAAPLATVLAEARRRTTDLIVKPPVPPPPLLPLPSRRNVVTLTGTREQVHSRLQSDLPAGRLEVTYRVLGDGDA